MLLDDCDETPSIQSGGRAVDRTALLACALADAEFTPKFTELNAPFDAALRPAMLDQGAAHINLARWTVMAEEINLKRVRTQTYSLTW